MTPRLVDVIGDYRPVRWLAGLGLLARGSLAHGHGQYEGMSDVCRAVRIGAGLPQRLARRFVLRATRRIVDSGYNFLASSYRSGRASQACASLYTVAGGGPHDIFRDLIVLKQATPGEKGVILLKYARTFDAVVAIFDLSRLMERYTFVLEPCWAGYCDPSILMFLAPPHPVIVQCFTEADFRFIQDVGAPLVPVRLGPADWVDADTFTPCEGEEKLYDLVMVANWARHKRHAILFRAVAQIRDRDLRILLVGFPWADRTAEDIRREAAVFPNPRVRIDIVEQVPQAQLARLLARCRVFLFLSRKEGDNKALVEAFFANVPAIVYSDTVGGAATRINPATGIFSSDEDLPRNILYMLEHLQDFSPREWALRNSGSLTATSVLAAALDRIHDGGPGTCSLLQKTNSPNLTYRDPGVRHLLATDYRFVLDCRHASPHQDIS